MSVPFTSDRSPEMLLVDRALPVIDTVIARRCRHWKMASDLREDMRAEVLLRLVRRLRDDDAAPIAGFEEYVAAVTSRVIDDIIRAVSPEWTRLKHRIRYVLGHDDRFRVTVLPDGRTVCSLQQPSRFGARRVHTQAADVLARSMIDVLGNGGSERLDDLVNEIAARTGVCDPTHITAEHIAAVRTPVPGAAIESAQSLRALWNEILELPRRQRLALLLHARDAAGDSVVRLLVAEAIVSTSDLASALEVSESELDDLLGRLPLMDATIAESLQITRQQVINLRSAARDRLARRMMRKR